MSLLLEALKKAEKAKEDAQRRARDERPSGEPEELHSEQAPAEVQGDAPPASQAAPPVRTRDQLPNISQPLEILSDDLLDKPAAATSPVPPRVSPTAEPAGSPRTSAAAPRDEVREQASRATARKVFEAKFREPNPRMPFYITMG